MDIAIEPVYLEDLHGAPDAPLLLDYHDRVMDGGFAKVPLHAVHCSNLECLGGYFLRSKKTVVWLEHCKNIRLRQMCASDANPDENYTVFGIHDSENCRVIDCAGWGSGRKIFSSSQKGNGTLYERCYGRWERSTCVGNKITFAVAYNSFRNLYRNCIGVCGALPEVASDFKGVFCADRIDGGAAANTVLESCLALSPYAVRGYNRVNVAGITLSNCMSNTASEHLVNVAVAIRLLHEWIDSPMLDRIETLAGVNVLASIVEVIETPLGLFNYDRRTMPLVDILREFEQDLADIDRAEAHLNTQRVRLEVARQANTPNTEELAAAEQSVIDGIAAVEQQKREAKRSVEALQSELAAWLEQTTQE